MRGLLGGLLAPDLGATWLRGLSYTRFRIGLYLSVQDVMLGDGSGNAAANGHAVWLCAGALTSGIGVFVFSPVDVVRVRIQVARCAYPSTRGAFGRVAQREGVADGL